ncbi:hypothetical protein [[Phormidium] sp. ETS-05]|uniref:hypothetical protein n=1 Tax=[Phormidium] sp. ETS-05 TaxID=222819 RepID=UPI0018EEF529|nr:hypothetical protein [[Phormidium] sp. ETS-05]
MGVDISHGHSSGIVGISTVTDSVGDVPTVVIFWDGVVNGTDGDGLWCYAINDREC